jgi:hypothetical protein
LYRAWFSTIATHQLWSPAAAVALAFIQALSVNILADEFRMLTDRTWLPGLFYALVTACLPDFLYLSPALVAATFIPMVLRRIFKAYNQPKATALVFDAAFWTVVSTLFYPPAVFLLIAVYFGLNIMRSYSFREQVVSLAGVLTAWFLAWLWYFWTDRGWDFGHIQFGGLLSIYRFNGLAFDFKTALQWVLPGLFVMVILLNYGNYMFRKLIQTQKCISVLYWFWFVAGSAFLLSGQSRPAHFLLMAAPTGIFLALTLSAMRKRPMAEIIHLILLAFVLIIQYYDRIEKFLA